MEMHEKQIRNVILNYLPCVTRIATDTESKKKTLALQHTNATNFERAGTSYMIQIITNLRRCQYIKIFHTTVILFSHLPLPIPEYQ